MKIKLLLNVLKRNNYVFFDPESRLHLSLGSPMGFANIVSNSVKRAILAGNIIDIEKTTGIEVSERVEAINKAVLNHMGYIPKIKPEEPTTPTEPTAVAEIPVDDKDKEIEVPKENKGQETPVEHLAEEKKPKANSRSKKKDVVKEESNKESNKDNKDGE